MTKLDGGSGIYYMTKTTGGEGTYYMTRIDSTLVEEGAPGGGGGVTYSWIPYLSTIQWGGPAMPSASWNNSPGSFTGAYGIYTAPAGYNYARIVGTAGYWRNSSGMYVGSLWLKSMIDANLAGSGTTYGASASASADWIGSSAIVELSASRQFVFGYYDPTPTSCQDYVTLQLYLSA
ncbi:MAG: hypothetical protein JW765_09800 [Deltaproteobacteria bacterium]|nr:hypothetical protein [Candidatus Zymogenaceae bacterium]